MKKQALALTLGLLLATAASAEDNVSKYGPYIGVDLGWGDVHQSNFNNVFAGRLFGGYDLSDYLATEFGYTRFANSTYKINNLYGADTIGTLKTYSVDAVLKLTMPLQYGLSLFGKLGAAYLNEELSLNVTSGSSSQNKVLPTFGLGMGYDFNRNLAGDISWMHIQKTSSTNLQNTDFVGAGLTYSFG